MIVSASCGIEIKRIVEYKPLLDRALEISRHQPDHCIILQRPEHRCALVPPRDLDWHELMASAQPAGWVPVAATDPLYILYTSGTTGMPKGIVRDNGGHAVALKWSMEHVYGVRPGEVFWAASDIGWVVGHSYIVYAPLLHGCTTVMYEGKPVGTPDPGEFWRVDRAAWRAGALHRADGDPGDQAGRSRGRILPEARRLRLAHALSRRRAARPGHLSLGPSVCCSGR